MNKWVCGILKNIQRRKKSFKSPQHADIAVCRSSSSSTFPPNALEKLCCTHIKQMQASVATEMCKRLNSAGVSKI